MCEACRDSAPLHIRLGHVRRMPAANHLSLISTLFATPRLELRGSVCSTIDSSRVPQRFAFLRDLLHATKPLHIRTSITLTLRVQLRVKRVSVHLLCRALHVRASHCWRVPSSSLFLDLAKSTCEDPNSIISVFTAAQRRCCPASLRIAVKRLHFFMACSNRSSSSLGDPPQKKTVFPLEKNPSVYDTRKKPFASSSCARPCGSAHHGRAVGSDRLRPRPT